MKMAALEELKDALKTKQVNDELLEYLSSSIRWILHYSNKHNIPLPEKGKILDVLDRVMVISKGVPPPKNKHPFSTPDDETEPEFISSSKILLESNKACEFKQMTKWCANQIIVPIESFRVQFQCETVNLIMDFKTYLYINYPHLSNFFDIHMLSVLPSLRKNDTYPKEDPEI